MNHTILLSATLLASRLFAASLEVQDPHGSLDRQSPEVQRGAVQAGDLIGFTPQGPRVPVPAQMLGLPPGCELDAVSNGFDAFDSGRPAGSAHTPTACFYSVGRQSQGDGGAVTQEAAGNGAAADVFMVEFVPQLTQPGLHWDAFGIDGQNANLDALCVDPRFPLFFSVDPGGAQQMSQLMNQPVLPGDVLWVPEPNAQPEVYFHGFELGLDPLDDIDALSVGPNGLLFSLTSGSPTAQLFPELGGAGIFAKGGVAWATAFELGLEPTDELDAILCLDLISSYPAFYSHTPMVPGNDMFLTVDGLGAGETAFIFGSILPPQQVNLFGLQLDIMPDFILTPMPPADPFGHAQMMLPVPPALGAFDLHTQAVIPNGAALNTWKVGNPVLFAAPEDPIKRIILRRNAGANGYSVVSPAGRNHVVRMTGVTCGGKLLNGTHWVTARGKLGGKHWVKQVRVTFKDGKAEMPTDAAVAGPVLVVEDVRILVAD